MVICIYVNDEEGDKLKVSLDSIKKCIKEFIKLKGIYSFEIVVFCVFESIVNLSPNMLKYINNLQT